MHLVEQYALACGAKIDNPTIEPSFFPIPFGKYLTLHASSGMEAKNYDYYNDVMRMIHPFLDKEGIKVVQIGAKEDKKILHCEHYTGGTSLKQTFYVIKNSLLHLGNDSFSTHVASGYNKPLVSIYSVLYKECCGPYWGDKEKQKLFEPNRAGKKCSFSDKESPKTVNEIPPEEIACAVLDLLNIKHNLNKIKTIHTGDLYHSSIIEVIPNFIMDAKYMSGSLMNIRMDYSFEERNLLQWAQNKKVNIFTDKPIEIEYLNFIKDKIAGITYELNKDSKLDYVEKLKSEGFDLILHTKNKEDLKKIRLKFFDYQVRYFDAKTKKDLDNSSEICNNSHYQSSKIILSNGQKYASKAAWLKDEPGVAHGNKIIDCPEFWEELDYIKIYNKEK